MNRALAFVLTLLVAAVALADKRAREEPLRIVHTDGYFASLGFVEMTPPIRLPEGERGRDRIRVWLKLGDGSITLSPVRARDGLPRLAFPPGTVAERVETLDDVVIDIRGTELLADGERFHVLVPEGARAQPNAATSGAAREEMDPHALVGWKWPRGDARAQDTATRALLTHLTATGDRARLDGYARNQQCARCHAHDARVRRTSVGMNRPTDHAGWFVPLSVLNDTAPLERHRSWDPNVGIPFVTVQCTNGGPVTIVEDERGRAQRCTRDELPIARFDVTAALAAGDAHARAVCASRRALFAAMDVAARAAFAPAFAVCAIETDGNGR